MKIINKFGCIYSEAMKLNQDFIDRIVIEKACRQIRSLPELTNPFFITGISGALHIMDLSLKYVPASVDMVLILNGMDKWEQEWVKKHFKSKAIILLDEKRMLAHSRILDLIFENYADPFGVMDYDCFVFNPNCFHALQSISSRCVVNSLFEFSRTNVKLRIPHTFFLFFNTPIIMKLKDEYHVNSGITDFETGITPKVKHQLAKIGINESNYPESNKNYFDTLRLLVCLAYSEGYSCSILDNFVTGPVPNSDVFYVGGVADPNYYKKFWSARGIYFWRRALEECKDQDLKLKYQVKYGNNIADDVFEKYSETKEQISQNFFDFVERIVH